jgi:nitrogen regulatory protein P-II 2
MRKTIPMKRVIIIGDNDLSLRILEEMKAFGTSGYTYYVVHGRGAETHLRRLTKEDPPNIKIEVIATEALAHRILDHVADNYIQKYAMIAFIDSVEVLASEHLGSETANP